MWLNELSMGLWWIYRDGTVLVRKVLQHCWSGITAVSLMLVIMCCCVIPHVAAAQPPKANVQGSQGTLTANITDPQNLLGSHVGAVTDAIQDTEHATGVHVRLLYVTSFDQSGNPDKWASNVLESSHPKPNTVLLAVATKDGNLVVAVSANSENWLRKQSTVDDLSQAALAPIADSNTPDWVESAQALMRQVKEQKHDKDQRMVIYCAVIAAAVVLLVVIGLVWYLLKHKRRHPQHGFSKHSGNVKA